MLSVSFSDTSLRSTVDVVVQSSRVPRVSKKYQTSVEMALSTLWAKSIEDYHLDTRILILRGRVSSKSIMLSLVFRDIRTNLDTLG